MTHLIHIEPFGGASGDMLLAALLDLGVPTQQLDDVIAALGLAEVKTQLHRDRRHGVGGQRLSIVTSQGRPVETSTEDQALRHWRQIRTLIQTSHLADRIKAASLDVLHALAQAESDVHGIDIEQVHFHEIGAVDTLVDVVGVCSALDHLGWPRLSVGTLPMGRGSIQTEHGVLPALAPATALLCRGLPIQGVDVEGECVTPTGAALLSTLASPSEDVPSGTLLGVGVGLGTRDPSQRANLLRVLHLRAPQARVDNPANEGKHSDDKLIELATNLDDDDPERCAYVVQRLLSFGVMDAWLTPIVMKKGRPAQTLHALVESALLTQVKAFIFNETSTLGLRWHFVQRQILERQIFEVDTAHGPVRVKRTYRPDGRVSYKPEFEDCERLATELGRPLIEIRESVLEAVRSGMDSP